MQEHGIQPAGPAVLPVLGQLHGRLHLLGLALIVGSNNYLKPDVPLTIFRPSIVMGDSRHAETTQFDMVRAFVFLAGLPALFRGEADLGFMRTAGLYWHFVDIIWFFVVSQIYFW